jgi:transposase
MKMTTGGARLAAEATGGVMTSHFLYSPPPELPTRSACKRRSNRLRKGSPWLKTTLVQCAWAAARPKGGYLQAQFHRLRARRGANKAICAVATAIYHMLKDGTPYHDLGPDYFQRRSKDTQTRRLVRSLEHLGYAVKIKPLAVAA